jgi:hypothetical protein
MSVLLLALSAAIGQTADTHIHVFDAQTKEPVLGAIVYLGHIDPRNRLGSTNDRGHVERQLQINTQDIRKPKTEVLFAEHARYHTARKEIVWTTAEDLKHGYVIHLEKLTQVRPLPPTAEMSASLPYRSVYSTRIVCAPVVPAPCPDAPIQTLTAYPTTTLWYYSPCTEPSCVARELIWAPDFSVTSEYATPTYTRCWLPY